MDRLQGPINPFEIRSESFEAEAVSSSCNSAMELSYNALFSHHHHQQQQMTFLQLLHGAIQGGNGDNREAEDERLQPFMLTSPFADQHSNFQLLLQLQSQQGAVDVECCRAGEQLESCITVSESEAKPEVFVAENNQDLPSTTMEKALRTPLRAPSGSVPRERKRRKRSRAAVVAAAASKSAEEVESQRMTHIAVERNRRRLMNDHLATLRSLMPSSYVQRGDQASIVGGAIEFVKELEQRLIALEALKRRTNGVETSSFDVGALHQEGIGFFVSPQYMNYSQSHRPSKRHRSRVVKEEVDDGGGQVLGGGVDVEATVVQGHVNLKVVAARRQAQIVRVIAALDELRLSVLHLNITTLDRFSVLYSFNLKIEEECKLGSADEIATAVQHIFTYINAC